MKTEEFRKHLSERHNLFKSMLVGNELLAKKLVEQSRRNYVVNIVTLLELYAREILIAQGNIDRLLDGDFISNLLFSLAGPDDEDNRERIARLIDLRNKIIHEDSEVNVSIFALDEFNLLVESCMRKRNNLL